MAYEFMRIKTGSGIRHCQTKEDRSKMPRVLQRLPHKKGARHVHCPPFPHVVSCGLVVLFPGKCAGGVTDLTVSLTGCSSAGELLWKSDGYSRQSHLGNCRSHFGHLQ